MDRLINSGTKGTKSDVTITEVLNKLAEYEGLEEYGKFLKLPCVVGKMVYEVQDLQQWKEIFERYS